MKARKSVRLVICCDCCWCWHDVSMMKGVRRGVEGVRGAEVEVVEETGLQHAPRGDAAECLHGGPPTNATADAP